jgi:hypothetical protein
MRENIKVNCDNKDKDSIHALERYLDENKFMYISDYKKNRNETFSIIDKKAESIIAIAEDFFNMPEQEFFKKTREGLICKIRQVVMFCMKRHTKLSLSDIGMICGRKDHSTVLHAEKTVNNILKSPYDAYYDYFVKFIRSVDDNFREFSVVSDRDRIIVEILDKIEDADSVQDAILRIEELLIK